MHDNRSSPSSKYTKPQLTALVTLRILIGWHLLYEGIAKALNPYWSSAGYLNESQWIFSDFFTALSNSPTALQIVDSLNTWGLIAIGAGLVAGCFCRAASLAGMILLLLYYLAAPPLAGLRYVMPSEGNYLIVNKTLIEAGALAILLLFPSSKMIGLDRLIFAERGRHKNEPTG